MLPFTDFEDEDINRIEKFSKTNLLIMLDLNECKREHLICIFGQFSSKPEQFVFLPDERELIHVIATHIKQRVMKSNQIDMNQLDEFSTFNDVSENNNSIKYELSQTPFGSIFAEDIAPSYLQSFCETINSIQKCEDDLIVCDALKPMSRTHQFLKKLNAIADRNILVKKAGYRFNIDIKQIATYMRVLGGALLYETIHRNLELAIPSIDTTNRFIRKTQNQMVEGCLRTNELLQYLNERSLPLAVAISEDATRISGRIEYDHRTNQISGFVLPINKDTGMPIPRSFPARTRDEILSHFAHNTHVANFVNVIMAKPLANYPSFCLLLYSSDGKYTSEDVNKRWNFIVAELQKFNIKVLTISSDSDPRYNSAMRRGSMLGSTSDIFDAEWFCSGLSEFYEFPFYVQDHVHNLTKLRNLFLRTGKWSGKLTFGPHYFIQKNHLHFLLQNYRKDQHELTPSTLDPVDKQNFKSALRMCSDKVIQLLKRSLSSSVGTMKFLEIMRAVYDSYCDPKLTPLERVEKLWYTVFILRTWRMFVERQNHLTLKDNFLTHYSYVAIEINAHSLIQIMIHLKNNNMEKFFLPFIFDSQACESFFRQIRSLTSVYSTVANCSTKEIIARLNKIQLLNDITHKSDFLFPRVKNKMEYPDQVNELPTKKQIYHKILECKFKAIEFAMDIGMLSDDEVDLDINLDLPCALKPTNFKQIGDTCELTEHTNQELMQTIARMKVDVSHMTLKNYANLFTNKEISETSSFVEICNDTKKRLVVKKTSLCWLLRGDSGKLSSDRIFRVRGVTTKTMIGNKLSRVDRKKSIPKEAKKICLGKVKKTKQRKIKNTYIRFKY